MKLLLDFVRAADPTDAELPAGSAVGSSFGGPKIVGEIRPVVQVDWNRHQGLPTAL